jgi:hypothetical protein
MAACYFYNSLTLGAQGYPLLLMKAKEKRIEIDKAKNRRLCHYHYDTASLLYL